MYTTYILFFISLAGIIVMIGRKLAPVRSGKVVIEQEHAHPFVPDIIKIKHFSYQSIKKYEHLILVATVRSYVRFTNFLKNEYIELKNKIINIRKSKNGSEVDSMPAEPSKFLKVISEYKQKVSHIKNRIEEEVKK